MPEREFTVVVEADEEGYLVASVPELRGCHTRARTLDELLERTRVAILLCLDDDDQAPTLKLLGVHRIAV